MSSDPTGWHVYRGTGVAAEAPIAGLPEPPPWRRFTGAHLGEAGGVDLARLVADFLERGARLGGLASDQPLNAVHLATQLATPGSYQLDQDWTELLTAIWHPLSSEVG